MNIKLDRRMIIFSAVLASSLLIGLGILHLSRPAFKSIAYDQQQAIALAQQTSFVWDLLESRKTKGVIAQLIPHDKITLAVDAVNALADKNAVRLTLLQPPAADQGRGEIFRRVRWDVQALASLKDLGVFLTEVRNMAQGVVDIDQLRVWPDEKRPDTVKAKITFVLLVAKDNVQK